jgi:hypothetical protein
MSSHTYLAALTTLLASAGLAAAAEVRGVVVKVDPAKNVLVVDARGAGARGQMFTFAITPDTQIQIAGQSKQIADLSAVRRVRVSFETRGGQHVAVSISSPGLLALVSELTNAKPAEPAAPNIPAVDDGPDTVRGELRRVAVSDRELVVLNPGTKQETILAVPDEVTVTREGKAARFEDLREGDQALVRAGERDGKRVALTVQVGAAAAAGAAPQETRIQYMRRMLKMLDFALDMAEKTKILERR